MHHDADLVRAETEQPVRFDHFQTFVHQGRRIDRNLRAHVPGRMLHGFGHRGGFNRGLVMRAKRPARCGENDPADLRSLLAAQALMQSVVFGINRQQLGAGFCGGARHQLAGHHQRFFVRQRNALPCFQGAQRRHKANGADRARDDAVSFSVRGNLNQAALANGDPRRRNVAPAQFGFQLFSGFFGLN